MVGEEQEREGELTHPSVYFTFLLVSFFLISADWNVKI